MKIRLSIRYLATLLSLALSVPCQAATVLPPPIGFTSISEWGGSTTFWTGTQPGPSGAPVAGVLNGLDTTPGATPGTYLLSTNVNVGSFGFPAYLPSGRNTTYTLTGTDYSGSIAPGFLSLQFVASYDPGTISLTAGSTVYSKTDATRTVSDASFITTWNPTRYQGNTVGTERLYTYIWDLTAVNASLLPGEEFPDFSVSFFRSGTNFNVYDVQLSVAPTVVPEPSVTLLTLGGLSALLLRRRRPVPFTPPSS